MCKKYNWFKFHITSIYTPVESFAMAVLLSSRRLVYLGDSILK